jgi:RHS repeat-associated protein
MHMVGHLAPADRKRLWAAVAGRLSAGGPVVLNVQPPAAAEAVPEFPWMSHREPNLGREPPPDRPTTDRLLCQVTTTPRLPIPCGRGRHRRPGPVDRRPHARPRPVRPGHRRARPGLDRALRLRRVRQRHQRRFYAIVTDHLGTPTELVDESGGIAWHARQTLWGITSRDARTVTDTPLRFPGQYFDPETGLHYNYFRHYDPANGQYTSADPLGLVGGANPRVYALNPMTWLDDLGLLTCKQNAKILRDNMAAEGRAPKLGEAAAHIVPSSGSQNQWAFGAKSRDPQDAHGVDINDAPNGIPPGDPTPHKLHAPWWFPRKGVPRSGATRDTWSGGSSTRTPSVDC